MKVLGDVPKEFKSSIKKTAKAFSRAFHLKQFEVNVSFVSEEEIRAINLQTRGIDAVTDVLSYPAFRAFPPSKEELAENFDPEKKRYLLGDAAICLARARAQAEEYGHSEKRECAYLFCHSLLHLAGYDHMREDDKKAMREKEEEILSAVGLIRGL